MPRKMATKHLTQDQKLIKALSFPLREAIFRLVSERGPISPVEISRESDENVTNVSHHMSVLKQLECVEEFETRQRRGATEHLYIATRKPWLKAPDLEGLSAAAQESMIGKAFELAVQDWVTALEAGTVGRDSNYVVARDRLLLDGRAYTKVREIIDRALEEIAEAEAESTKRRGESSEEGIKTAVSLMCFPLPS